MVRHPPTHSVPHRYAIRAEVIVGPILVTGVSGYVGSRVVEALLNAGHAVRGTVRSIARAPKLDMLPGAERLEIVEADLLVPGSYDAAAKDAVGVIHTASVYQVDAKDPQKEIVDPALKGTMEVLEAAMRSSSVRRVVLTSSMAAVTDSPERRVMNEDDWNTQSTLTRNAYYYSKAIAERAAWRFLEERKPAWDLVVVNPSLTIGPSLVPSLNTSNKIFADLLNGAYPAIMDLAWSMVDVRDVAQAHLRAFEVPTAKGRHVCAAETLTMRRVIGILERASAGTKNKLPKLALDNAVGTAMTHLASYMQPKGVGVYLRTNLGRPARFDNTKIQGQLGMSFRPIEPSIVETVADLRKWGHIR
jgi:dihydroflavonol-4-reductase